MGEKCGNGREEPRRGNYRRARRKGVGVNGVKLTAEIGWDVEGAALMNGRDVVGYRDVDADDGEGEELFRT